ncbi:Abasic site processing protein YoqW [Gammaproteobacteria bacterium]
MQRPFGWRYFHPPNFDHLKPPFTQMCGRYALHGPRSRIREQFDLDEGFDFDPRYNIAPTAHVLVVRPSSQGRRVGSLCRWGLIPGWAKDMSIGAKLNNARGETVAEKPAFREAFRRWRCLVPANGFFEWKSIRKNGRMVKQPYYIRPKMDGDLFGFAGLTERWVSSGGEKIHSCCIITTGANALMQPIHDRMPVILSPGDYAAWLNPANTHTEMLHALLRPADATGMVAHPVSRAVNSSRSDSPSLVEPGQGQDLRQFQTASLEF